MHDDPPPPNTEPLCAEAHCDDDDSGVHDVTNTTLAPVPAAFLVTGPLDDGASCDESPRPKVDASNTLRRTPKHASVARR